jgi:2-polyprenyl-3-methyl-5-hydroxy-6-metoxy-1,4-benzoquinol methylase
MDEKQTFYDRFAGEFDRRMDRYDLERRLQVVFETLLPESLGGCCLLDAGSGTGWFSMRAKERGACVISLDIGPNLLQEVGKKCRSERVQGSICVLPFADATFDVVVSSEVIEHVPNPHQAFHELGRVLKPGGLLALTTPNRLWHFAISLANWMGARPYEGYENWVGYTELAAWANGENLQVVQHFGFHLFPFVGRWTYPLLRWLDCLGNRMGNLYLNQAILLRK